MEPHAGKDAGAPRASHIATFEMNAVTPSPSSSSSAPFAPSGLLAKKIGALRWRHVSVAVLTGLAVAVIIAVEMLALAMFLDWWLDLPWGTRLALLLIQAGVIGFVLVRAVILPLIRQPEEDELALMVEKATPSFRSRLIAAMQLTRPGAVPTHASQSMVGALVEETESLARPQDFRRIVPTDRLRRVGAMAILVPVIALLGFAAGRETCSTLLKRAFLSNVPVPRKTRILVPDGPKRVGRGDNVRLEAYVEGIIPGSGKVVVKSANRRPQEFSLEQNREQPAHFARTLENVQDSFTYQIFLNDGVSPVFPVQTIERPTVASLACEQVFPAYTKLPVTTRAPGDLTLLAGSVLKLDVAATKELKAALIRLNGADQELPLALNVSNATRLTGEFTVPTNRLNGFQIQMLDTDDMESRDAAVYRVEIVPDKPPAVRLTYPERKEELVTRVATLLLGFEASDDFQIARVRLKYKVDTLDNGEEKSVELDLEAQRPQRLKRRHEWKLSNFAPLLSEGSVIEYWIEAEDNNDTTGPGLGRTDHQLARVVSAEEKRADLLNRAGDSLAGISDVAADQEKLNRTLGEIIREKAGLR